MWKKTFICIIILLFLLYSIPTKTKHIEVVSPHNLMCEWKTNNTNVKDPKPEFYWECEENQTAFQILVSSSLENISSDIGDMWDSGKVIDTRNFTEYDGIPLENNTTYYWKIRIWNETDVESSYSYVSTFRTNFSPLYSHFSHIRTFVAAYGNYNESIRKWIAGHFDLTINENVQEYNPNVINLNYILYATMVSPSEKSQKLREFCNETGCDYEDMFLHLNRDTNFTLPVSNPGDDDPPVETRTVKGWDYANDWNGDGYVNDTEYTNLTNPNATARYRNESRVPIYYWNPPDNIMYIGNKNYQRFIVNYSLEEIGNESGLFIDTTTSRIPIPPNARGNIFEYPDETTQDSEWNRDMQYLLVGVKKAMPSKILIGNGWNASPLIIEGRLLECWKNLASPLTNAWDSFDSYMLGLNAVIELDKRGEIQLIQYNPKKIDIGNSSEAINRDYIFGLASYYLVHGNFTYFGVGKHPYSNISESWFDAMSFNIGKPLGSFYIFASSFEYMPQNNLINNGGFEIDNGTDFDPNRTSSCQKM